MAISYENLRHDVQAIYSNYDKSTRSEQCEYDFEGNKVTILFTRVWEGMAEVCGKDLTGSAVVKMQTRDPILEKKITENIEFFVCNTMSGMLPVVENISFQQF